MFVINEDKSVYVTRGDVCEIPVSHQLHVGDNVRIKITRKKDCESVVLQRDFNVQEDTTSFVIFLNGDDTKLGEVISKPTDYWYEIELNPDTHPETIVGYDEDGAKIFRLYPEGKDVDGEDIEVVGHKTLQELVDYALEQAKESGEFKGDKGDPGYLGNKTAEGGEIFNFYTDPVYTGDNPPKEYPGNTAAKGSHAEGFGTHADGQYAHAEGWVSTASGGIAHAEGRETQATGYASHAEGGSTKATSSYTHSEGFKTEANAPYSHTEGEGSKTLYDGTNGKYAHAEGYYAETSGTAAHAQGVQTVASGYASHAAGRGTIANCRYQTASGMFNEPDKVKYSDGRGSYAEIVGGGTNTNNRKNIHTLDWDGLGWFAGGLKIGGTSQNDKNAASVLTTADMATITQAVIAALPRYNGEVVAE